MLSDCRIRTYVNTECSAKYRRYGNPGSFPREVRGGVATGGARRRLWGQQGGGVVESEGLGAMEELGVADADGLAITKI